MSNTLKSVVVVLAIIAIFLGYKIYSVRQESSTAETNVGDDLSSETDEYAPVSSSDYTNTDVLKTPNIDSPESEKIGFADLVRAKAVETNVLNITSCKPQPIAIAVKNGSTLTLKNSDTVARTISFGGTEESYKVEPKSTRSIEINKQVETIYAYGCDGSQGPAGMMLVK